MTIAAPKIRTLGKTMKLASIDITLFVVYVVALTKMAWWVSREKEGHEKDTNEYCLAG